jgi:Abortive infection alpha
MSDSEGGGLTSIVKAGAEAVSEVAKVEQAKQKTYQLGLDLVRRAGGFLGGVFEPASKELGHLFGDQMKFWRFKNAVRILEKAQALVEARGLRPDQMKALGFGEGLLLLEAASMEEGDEVQELWARLMANAVDPSAATKAEKVYVDILKSVSAREAVFLDLMAQIEEKGHSFKSIEAIDAFGSEMSALAESKWRKYSEDERAVSVQNLVRLRCITARPAPIDVSNLFATLPQERGGRGAVSFGLGGSSWAAIDPNKFQKVLQELVERQMVSSGMVDFKSHSSFVLPVNTGSFFGRNGRKMNLPEANFMLTPLGKGLARACRGGAPSATQEA